MLTSKSFTSALVLGAGLALSLPAWAQGAGDGAKDQPAAEPAGGAASRATPKKDTKCPPGAYCEEAAVEPPPELAAGGEGTDETAAAAG
ncbi:MAG: hypothetical protein JRI23_25495, partial [Deltaproteobacteria bacterium]|nr:hypothetical protein [Deltaproteobacteria bacterium]MBW2535377.1 hypothetical protein [Deltaproteobacteria bacterium]